MRALVTGAAGFVGSHLCAHLLAEGDDVVGVDCFTSYYGRALKERNLAAIDGGDRFRFVEDDLTSDAVAALIGDVDVVYHLAAQPGVRPSWGPDFGEYVRRNVLATQQLLEGCAGRDLQKLVFASSSSIYGDAETFPTTESVVPRPVSPYGVTKLAAEHLCEAYRRSGGVPTASLRLFTVYGPRQRPDMAFARLVRAAVDGAGFEVFGDGEQTRDFTYVGDVARAFRACALSGWTGVANIGGGARTSVNDAIRIVGDLAKPVTVTRGGPQRGDVRHTAADITLAREAFGWSPETSLPEGLRMMVDQALRERDEQPG